MNSGTRSTVLLAVVVPVVALAAAVTTLLATDAPSTSASSTPRDDAIVIRNFVFAPSSVAVTRGTTITVTNADGTRHSVTADNGSFDTGDLDGGARAELVIDRPGRFAYHCDIHDYMKGTIEVQG